MSHTNETLEKYVFYIDLEMILVPFFDIPSGLRLGKVTEECPFQGPVFFALDVRKRLFQSI